MRMIVLRNESGKGLTTGKGERVTYSAQLVGENPVLLKASTEGEALAEVANVFNDQGDTDTLINIGGTLEASRQARVDGTANGEAPIAFQSTPNVPDNTAIGEDGEAPKGKEPAHAGVEKAKAETAKKGR